MDISRILSYINLGGGITINDPIRLLFLVLLSFLPIVSANDWPTDDNDISTNIESMINHRSLPSDAVYDDKLSSEFNGQTEYMMSV